MYKYLNEPSKSFLMIIIGVNFAVLGLAVTMVGAISIENISITLALFTRSSATVHAFMAHSYLRTFVQRAPGFWRLAFSFVEL